MSKNNAAIWSEELQCEWEAWMPFPGDPLALGLTMPEGACCDMTGCIEVAKRIHPDVRKIITFAGGEPDTVYVLVDGEWAAWPPTVRGWVSDGSGAYRRSIQKGRN